MVLQTPRISYVGELGWELYISAEQSCHIYELLERKEKNII